MVNSFLLYKNKKRLLSNKKTLLKRRPCVVPLFFTRTSSCLDTVNACRRLRLLFSPKPLIDAFRQKMLAVLTTSLKSICLSTSSILCVFITLYLNDLMLFLCLIIRWFRLIQDHAFVQKQQFELA